MHPGNWIGVGAAAVVLVVLAWQYLARRTKG